jgi:uncharacterized protein YjbI with pentapeptide repeats
MARLFRPTRPLLDGGGQPVVGLHQEITVTRFVMRWVVYALVSLTAALVLWSTALVGYRLWRVPDWALSPTQGIRDSLIAYRTSMGEVFQGLVQLSGGVFLGFGAWLAWRQFSADREVARRARRDSAIHTIASDREELRVAGIYELESIARESEQERPKIVEILAGMIRTRSRQQEKNVLAPDVEAALLVVASLNTLMDGKARLNLSEARLCGAVLRDIDLRGARLSRADLRGSDLSGARLNRADLSRALLMDVTFNGADFSDYANLSHVCARNADFTRARLRRAPMNSGDFRKAQFYWADLYCAMLTAADCREASFMDAELTGTDFNGTDLRGADLSSVKTSYLTGTFIHTDARTKWPPHMTPRHPSDPLSPRGPTPNNPENE